jgi:DNA-binding MarR family transcriptional regulator
MRRKPDNTVVLAWARMLKTQKIALGSIEQALKAADLPPLEWYDVLLELKRAGDRGLRPFELERETLLAQYNLSRLIDRIAKTGSVERRSCEADGRGQVIVITCAGTDLLRRMWTIYGAAIQSAFGDHLTADEAETLAVTLGALIEKIKPR